MSIHKTPVITQKRPLLTLPNVPPWFEANPFILTGYRPESQSWSKSLSSWLYIHNETANIYSHLIPGLCLLLLLINTSIRPDPEQKQQDQHRLDNIVLTVQLCAAILCLLTSALYHTTLNHSARVAHQALQCDHGGILALILGNFVSGLHFGFYCEPALKNLYWSLVSFTFPFHAHLGPYLERSLELSLGGYFPY